MKKLIVAAALLVAGCETARTAENETPCPLPDPYIEKATGLPMPLPPEDIPLIGGMPRTKGQTLIARAIRDDTMRTAMAERLGRRAAAHTPQDSFSVLMLSTGGGWGAFGSGLLQSWQPPEFDLVTGGSTGSVIAPFAFLGTPEDLAFASEIYLTHLTDKNTLTKRSLWQLLTASALHDTKKMRKMMVGFIREKSVISRVAAQGLAGRTLAVAAVNVDSGLTEVFDLTAIASQKRDASKETAKAFEDRVVDEFVSPIMASVAIPVAFEPVFINKCMYQDAGLRQQLFMSGEFIQAIANTRAPGSATLEVGRFGPEYRVDLEKWVESETAPIAVEIFMLVNGTANEEPELDDHGDPREVSRGLLPIAKRDLGLLLNQSMWASIDRARLVGVIMGWEMSYNDASKFWGSKHARELPPKKGGGGVFGSGPVFDELFMEKLNAYGRDVGSSPVERWGPVPGSPDIMSPPIPKKKPAAAGGANGTN